MTSGHQGTLYYSPKLYSFYPICADITSGYAGSDVTMGMDATLSSFLFAFEVCSGLLHTRRELQVFLNLYIPTGKKFKAEAQDSS